MVEKIIGYHGTLELEGIILGGGIQAPLWREGGEKLWLKKRDRYLAKSKKYAKMIRALDNGEFLRLRHPEIFNDSIKYSSDELLASIYLEYSGTIVSREDSFSYGRGIDICIAKKKEEAFCYSGKFDKQKIGAVLKVEIRSNQIKPVEYAHYQFMKGILGIDQIKGILIDGYIDNSRHYFERAKKLLESNGLNIPLNRSYYAGYRK